MSEPAVRFSIESAGNDYYLVTGEQDGETVELRCFVDPGLAEEIGEPQVSGERIVEATLAYLLGHQRLDDLPTHLDIGDVAAAYDDFTAQLQARLADS